MTKPSTALTPFSNVPPVKRPTGSGPLLQWFNGLPAGRSLATGWHIQANRCSEALNEALKALKCPRLTVLHKMTGELVEYWSLETCSLIVLCNGFTDTWEMKSTPDRDGIAYGWIEEKQKSKVKARVFIDELAQVGYLEHFTITLEGMITEEFFTALEKQFDVLDAYERLAGHAAPFYGFSLTLAPAEKPKMVGRGKQSPIVPMVAQVPQSIDEEYLEQHLCTPELLTKIIEQGLVEKAIQWSVETSRRITVGEDRETWETPEYEASLNHNHDRVEPSPAEPATDEDDGPAAADEPATKQQLASIEKLCQKLNRDVPEVATYNVAVKLLAQLSKEYNESKRNGVKK